MFLVVSAVTSSTCVVQAAEKNIKPGDKVKVTIGPAPLKIGKKTLTTVEAGTELTALKVQGHWVRVTIEKDGKKITGWIHKMRLNLATPKSRPKPGRKIGDRALDDHSKAEPKKQPGTALGREELIAALVARGEKAFARNRQSAQWAYRFAALYAPNDPQIAAKRKAIGGWEFSASNAEIARMQRAIRHTRPEDFQAWPASTAEMELVELRMLLDSQLVGRLRYTQPTFQRTGSTAILFLSKPTRTLAQVRSMYGKPSAQEKRKGGVIVLTYGRFRLIAEKSGKVAGVFFRRF